MLKNSFKRLLNRIPPAHITALYIIAGAAFVAYKHDLIAFFPTNTLLTKSTNSFIDYSILLASAAVLHIFLINFKSYVSETTTDNQQFLKNKLAYLSWVFIILLVVPLANLGIYQKQLPKVEQSTYDHLASITSIKVQRISNWLQYRVADGAILANSDALSPHIKKLVANTTLNKADVESSRAVVTQHFQSAIQAYKFESITLFNQLGQPILQIGDSKPVNTHPLNTDIAIDEELLATVKSSLKAQHGDFFIDAHKELNLQVLAPVLSQPMASNPGPNNKTVESSSVNKPNLIIAYILIQTGFANTELPTIQTWPSSFKTAEVMLVKQEESQIVVVNGTPNDFNGDGLFIQKNNPKSLYNTTTIHHAGLNLINEPAYAISTAIPNTNWFYFAEISQKEALADLNSLLFWISISALLTASIIALVLFLLWKQQKSAYKLALSIKDTELNKLLDKFHTMPFIGFGTIDAKTRRWQTVNPRLCEILGYSEKDFKRSTYTDFNHTDENSIDDSYYAKLSSGELNYYTREKRFIHKLGHVIYTQVEVTAVRNDYGGIDTNVVAVKDITEHVKAEQALIASEERLELVVRGSNDGWWDLDLVTNTAHHSERWWQMLGYDQNMDIIDPQHWQTLTHPDDISPLLTYLRRILTSTETHYEVELRLRHKEGHYLDILTRGYIIRNEFGKAIRIAGTNTDITAFKKADREIVTLNRLLSMVTNTNQLITRKPGSVVLFNEVCKIAVNDGGFSFAWVGLLTQDQSQLKCITYSGRSTSFIESLDHSLTSLDYRIPAIQCINEGQYIICNDLSTAKYEDHWVQSALLSGYRSMVALPIARFGKVVGNFSLFSNEAQAFSQKEVALLDELAADISYALEIEENETLRKKTEKALSESEALFHNLASNSPTGVFRTDEKGKLTYYNDIWRSITAASIQELVDGIAFPASIHEEDSKSVLATFKKCLSDRASFDIEFRFEHADKTLIWVKCQAQPSLNAKGIFNGFVGTLTDVTELKQVQDSLYMSGLVIKNTREAILVTDSDINVVMINKAFTEIEGYTPEDILGKNPRILNSGKHNNEYFEAMFSALKDTGEFQSEIWNKRKNGEIHPGILSITAVKNAKQKVTHYVSVFTDITNLKHTEERLAYLANHDTLTGLPNRMMLTAHISHAIEGAKRNDKKIALLLLDLDRFKNVNDSFGHIAGDDLLTQLAYKLKTKLRGNDMIARLGGDEFVILLEDISQPEYAAKVAKNVIEIINEPWELNQQNAVVSVGTSIGISIYPDHGDNAQDLLKHADAAMYQAKNSGRGTVRYYSEQLTRQARRRLKLESRLREAIDNNELRLHYQPKLDVFSGKVTGAEALVRWIDPKAGMIMPNEFISIAEETGLIKKLGAWVLNEACRQGKEWLNNGIQLTIAVNISATQLYDDDITKTIRDTLKKTGFPAKNLELELTESILMRREAESIKKLYQIKELGISLAVDDFGAGYSSLSYLRRFPLDVLKVDRSFIADLDDDKDDRAITATIIGIGRTLNLTVVAEGVETTSQLNFLESHGCHQYQGFYASPPLEAALFEAFIKEYKGNNIFN